MRNLLLLGIFLSSQFLLAQVGIQTQNPVRELHIGNTNTNVNFNNIRIDGLNQTNNLMHKPENDSESLFVDKDGVLVLNNENGILEQFKKTNANTEPFTVTTMLVTPANPVTSQVLYEKNFTNNIESLLMYTFQPRLDFTPNLDNAEMFMFNSTRNVGIEILISKETTPGVFVEVYKHRKSNPFRSKLGWIEDYTTTGEYMAGMLKATTNISDMVPLESGNYKLIINGFAYRSFDDNVTQDQIRNPYKVRFDMAEHSEMNFFLVTP